MGLHSCPSVYPYHYCYSGNLITRRKKINSLCMLVSDRYADKDFAGTTLHRCSERIHLETKFKISQRVFLSNYLTSIFRKCYFTFPPLDRGFLPSLCCLSVWYACRTRIFLTGTIDLQVRQHFFSSHKVLTPRSIYL